MRSEKRESDAWRLMITSVSGRFAGRTSDGARELTAAGVVGDGDAGSEGGVGNFEMMVC